MVDPKLIDLVESVRAIPYGRPSDGTVEGMWRERRGTCSTKHLYLANALTEGFPDTEPQIIHRVYRIDRATAEVLFGDVIATSLPTSGIVDVHRYLRTRIEGRQISLDVTLPGEPWDGRTSMTLACGPGEDFAAGADPDSEKRKLENEHCDAILREPFITALSKAAQRSAEM